MKGIYTKMFNNPYLYNKVAQHHNRELVQASEKQRMLDQLPRRQSKLMQNVARQFAAFRVSLPFSAKPMKQSARTATGQL